MRRSTVLSFLPQLVFPGSTLVIKAVANEAIDIGQFYFEPIEGSFEMVNKMKILLRFFARNSNDFYYKKTA